MKWLWRHIIKGVRFCFFVCIFAVLLCIMIPFQIALVIYFLIFKATDKRKYRYHCLIQRTCQVLAQLLPGVKIEIRNRGDERFERPAIVVCNHQSHLDLLCLLILSPKILFMAKKWVWRNPLYSIAIRYADFISSEDSYEDNIQKLSQLAHKGYFTVIFPEGSRSASCKMQRFHRGAFHAAEALQLDIIPIVLYGTGKVMNKKAFSITPGKIVIDICERIPYDAAVDYRQRTREVKELMVQRYNQIEDEQQGSDNR